MTTSSTSSSKPPSRAAAAAASATLARAAAALTGDSQAPPKQMVQPTTTASSLPAVVLPLCDSQTETLLPATEVFPDADSQPGLDGKEFQYRLNDEELYTVDQGLAGAGSLGFFTNAVVAVAAAAALVGLWIGNRLRLPLCLGFQPGPRAWARHFGKR